MFGYQENGERPQFRGIPLFSPCEEISVIVSKARNGYILAKQYIGKEYPIADFGSAKLWFIQETEVMGEKDWYGRAILNGKLERKRESILQKKGLYTISLDTKLFGKPDVDQLNTQILLPNGIVLDSNYECWGEEENWDEYSSFRWSLKDVEENFPYYVPLDPDFLSSLRFTFSFSSNLHEIKPSEE